MHSRCLMLVAVGCAASFVSHTTGSPRCFNTLTIDVYESAQHPSLHTAHALRSAAFGLATLIFDIVLP
jgi:hypothetical protein